MHPRPLPPSHAFHHRGITMLTTQHHFRSKYAGAYASVTETAMCPPRIAAFCRPHRHIPHLHRLNQQQAHLPRRLHRGTPQGTKPLFGTPTLRSALATHWRLTTAARSSEHLLTASAPDADLPCQPLQSHRKQWGNELSICLPHRVFLRGLKTTAVAIRLHAFIHAQSTTAQSCRFVRPVLCHELGVLGAAKETKSAYTDGATDFHTQQDLGFYIRPTSVQPHCLYCLA